MTILDPHTGELVYTNAGHNPPLLVRASGEFEALGGGGMILGILPMATYQESQARMEIGDALVLFSDGITEAPNPEGDEFGEQRLAALVASVRTQPSVDIIEEIHKAVNTFTQGAPAADDITVVIARRVNPNDTISMLAK
jgi:serine phosphatase RsbU (regulator of sigma subunit)